MEENKVVNSHIIVKPKNPKNTYSYYDQVLIIVYEDGTIREEILRSGLKKSDAEKITR